MTMGKTVCILTTVHSVFDTRIFHKQAKTLVDAGYEVTLITQHARDEIVDGVKILALPTPRNRFDRGFRLAWRVFRLAVRQRADVYHIHDPELLGIGLLLRVFMCSRIIYDVHEDVPQQILGKEWVAKRLRLPVSRLYHLFEKALTLACDAVVPATEAIARNLRHRRVQVIHNYPHLKMFHTCEIRSMPNPGIEHRVLYIGGISRRRGIMEMLAALDCFQESERVQLDLIGPFLSPKLGVDLRLMLERPKVNYRGKLPWNNAWAYAQGATAGLVLLHPGPNHSESLPTKLFEYMAAGIPVIASDFPIWQKIVHGSVCGLTVDPLDPTAIGDAIKYLLEHPEEAKKMGQNGRRAVEEKYNWEAESKKLLDLYERILS